MARLNIPDVPSYAEYTVTTAQAVFPFNFPVFAKEDLQVFVGDVDVTQSGFTFSGAILDGGGYQGGQITLNTAAAATTVLVQRSVSAARASQFAPANTVPIGSVDQALNRLTAIQQDVQRDLARIAFYGLTTGLDGAAARAAIGADLAANSAFQRPETGAVVLSSYLKNLVRRDLTDFIPPALYAGIRNNTNTTPLDASISAALTGLAGGRLFVPEGHYLHSAGISLLDLPAFEMIGGAPTGTVFHPQHSTGVVFDVGSATAGTVADVNIRGIGVSASSGRTNGAAFRFRNVKKVAVENMYFDNQAVAVEVGTGCVAVSIGGGGKFNIVNPTALTGLGVLVTGGIVTKLRSLLIEGNQASQGLGAIKIVSSADVDIRDCEATFSRDSLIIEPGAGQVVEQIFTFGNTWDTGSGNGVVARGAGTIRLIESEGDWAATNGDVGFYLAPGPTIQNVKLSDFQAYNNGNEGVLAANCAGRFMLQNSLISGNSADAAGLYDGIRVTAGVPVFMATGCSSGISGQFTNAQRYGMRVDAGTYDRYTITGNDLGDNASGALSDLGTGTKLISNVV